MSTHDQAPNIGQQFTECTCCGQSSGCECRIEVSRGRILRALQNASKADLSENRPQLLQRGSPTFSGSGRRFIPRGSLLKILDRGTVAEHLNTLLDDLHRSNLLADYISPGQEATCHCEDGLCTGSRIILASLMRIGKEDRLINVYNQPNARVCDKNLKSSDKSQTPELFDGLTEKEEELFRHAQRQLRSHYLRKLEPDNQNFRQLDDEAALPFLPIDGSTSPINGDLSVVRHIRIDPNHHDLGNGSDFALKTLKKLRYSNEENFQNEFNANQHAPRHDRIVPVLTAFKHRQRFHFIFPYASGGNLEELWKTYSPGNASGSQDASWYSPQWLLNECLGIAESLAATHQLTTVAELGIQRNLAPQLHADFKPRNILCFETIEGGNPSFTLKLADFGFARKVNEDSTLEVGDVTHTKTYRPPEYDTEDTIHLNYDVWCLGCVYIEFITWALIGWAEVEKFAKSRINERDDPHTSTARGEDWEDTFFKRVAHLPHRYGLSGLQLKFHRETQITSKKTATNQRVFRISRGTIRISCRVKDAVTKHIGELRKHENCVQEFRKFLDFVEARMLVIDARTRANSKEVEVFLRTMMNEQRSQE
ncbi:kinase-like protein [Xylaria sp. FL1777]|nr:kinase-like protein [Xylaria sp. FL1777]